MVRSMRYNMRMTCVPIYVESNVFSINEVVWKIDSRPKATLKKNHVFIWFHYVCKAFAIWLMHVIFVKGKNSLTDCLTKPMSIMEKQTLCWRFMYWYVRDVNKGQGLPCDWEVWVSMKITLRLSHQSNTARCLNWVAPEGWGCVCKLFTAWRQYSSVTYWDIWFDPNTNNVCWRLWWEW